MKLGILSCEPKSYSTRRFKEAALKRGHTVNVLNTLKFAVDIQQGIPDLYYRQNSLNSCENYDAVLPRIGPSITYYGTAVVRQCQEMDIYCANTARGIANSRDKLRSMQMLSLHNFAMPRTTFVRDETDVLPAIERVGGAPVVIKLIESTQGKGVLLAETIAAAQSIVELLQSQNQNVLIQKFVAESKGRDIRAFVVGDRVVAAMRRVAQGQEFRSNVHRGGVAEVVDLPQAYIETAVRAAQILGLRIAGVDMLECRDGPQVLEVNSSPGLEGIETCTGLDVAGAVIDYIAAQVDFPEIDIRQRLNVSKGYGVSEISVPEGSKFVGISIADTNLANLDINVLTLYRGNKVIPNPRAQRILEANDRLLCYGKLDSMRSMVPSKTRQRRRPEVHELMPNYPLQVVSSSH